MLINVYYDKSKKLNYLNLNGNKTLKSVKLKAYSEMKSSDDNSPQLVQIGASILDQAMENSSDFSDHPQTNQNNRTNDQIYLHTVKLSNLLKSFKIHDVKFVSLKPNEVSQIKQQIDVLFDDLRNTGKSVTIDVGPGSSAYEALRIISYALMAISNNNNNSNSISTSASTPVISTNDTSNYTNNILTPTTTNINSTIENHFSEPSMRAGSGVIEDNQVRLENAQLKNKLIAFQEQFENEKNIQSELMKQNAQLNSVKIDLLKKIDELTEKVNYLGEKTKNDQEKLELLKYEREAQYNIDSTQIEKLREKSVRDSRKIRELQEKFKISPDEVQNSYIASLLEARVEGAQELLNYVKEEFQLDESLSSPRSILPQLKIAVEDRKKHPILAEQGMLAHPQPTTTENNDIFVNAQIESYQAQIEDLKNQLALAKSNVDFNSNVIEKGRINDENNMRDLLLQNYNLETQVSSLKTENERLSAELHATNQYIKSSKESSISSNQQQQQQQQQQLKASPNDENSIYVLESEIKANKIKMNELTDQSNKRKEKIFALNQTVSSLQDDLKSKEAIISNLRMQLDKLSIERDDLIVNKSQQGSKEDSKDEAQLNSELKLVEAENKKLNHALSELSNEMESLTMELEREGKEKNSILELLQKHAQALSESETQLKSLQNQINKKDDEIHLFKQNNEKLKLQLSKKFVCKHKEVIENIQQFFFSSNNNNNDQTLPKECQNQIMDILNSSNEPISIVLQLFEYLQEVVINSSNRLQRANEQELLKLQEQNNRLFIYISNLLVFIDQLANSGELQKWIIGANYEIDYRPQLLAQYGRIDNFIKQHCKNNINNNSGSNNNNNGNDNNEDTVCKEFITDFPSFVEKFTNGKIDEDQNREHTLVMQLCFSSNDLLRKFADKLLVQNETLQTDINHIRRELMQTSNETDEKISEATKETVIELENERERRLRVEDTLNKIAKKLRGSKTTAPEVLNSVEQCLNLIDDDRERESESDSYSIDNRPKRSVQKEIKKAEMKKEQAYKANQILAQKAKEKIKKLKIIINSQAAQIEELKSLKDKYTDIKKENETLQQYLSHSQAENEKNEKALKDIHRQMKENEALKDSTFSKYKEESELQISSLQEELDDWKRKSECTDVSTQEEVRRIKHDAKVKLKKMQSDLLTQVQRVEDTRSHFEPLLNELREKLNSSRAAEKQLQDESQKYEIERKQLKSELTTARIDLKMAQMKLNAAEEKVARDKNLIESQYRMKITDLQSKNLSALEDQKNRFDTEFHSFLVSICQKFKDFVDFNEMITKESVEKTLDKICQKLKDDKQQLKVYEEMNNELVKLRSLLGLQENESVLPTISMISKDASEFNKSRTELEEKQKELENLMQNAKEQKGKEKLDEEWESWARRVYTLISDFSSTAQTAKELQFALEEALLGNIGQRLTTRRLGTLRTEKQILLTGLLANMSNNNINSRNLDDNKLNRDRKGRSSLTPSKNKDLMKLQERKKMLSIRHILIMLTCIRKMQKISGHIKCSIISPKRKREKNEKEEIDINLQRDKGYPILNSNE